MLSNIKPGFMLHIFSYENDGDYQQTAILTGLSKSAAKFWVEFAKLVGGEEFGNYPWCSGRDSEQETALMIRFQDLVKNNQEGFDEIKQENTVSLDCLEEFMFKIDMTSDEFMRRRYTGYAAYLIKEEHPKIDLFPESESGLIAHPIT